MSEENAYLKELFAPKGPIRDYQMQPPAAGHSLDIKLFDDSQPSIPVQDNIAKPDTPKLNTRYKILNEVDRACRPGALSSVGQYLFDGAVYGVLGMAIGGRLGAGGRIYGAAGGILYGQHEAGKALIHEEDTCDADLLRKMGIPAIELR